MSRIRLLYAHPMQSASEVNVPMYKAVNRLPNVDAIDLYGVYPRKNIDIKLEQQALVDSDVLIIQSPIFWYSVPAIVSIWFALVLQHGFAFGTNGDKLHGKKMMLVLSAGGPLDAYQNDGLANYSLRELFRHVEQTANLVGMDFLPPYVIGASRTAREEGRVEPHVDSYIQLVKAITEDRLDENKLAQLDVITHDDISGLIKER